MPLFDIICDCGYKKDNHLKTMKDPYPTCPECGSMTKRDWSTFTAPSISWKGPGGSPLRGGGPTKPSFNTNESEVEQELFNSIYEEED